MKMIAAARYAKAEKELKPVRLYGGGATGNYLFVIRRWVLDFPFFNLLT